MFLKFNPLAKKTMNPIYYNTNSTTPHQPELTGNLLQNKIKEAIDRGLFTPYASKLREYRHGSYRADWFNILERTASGELKGEIIPLLCFLFATTIDPDTNEESKKNSIRQALNFLSEKELSGLYSTLGRRDTPSIISTNILLHFTSDAWEKTCKKMLTYDGIRESAETFTSWIKEILDNKWENSAKKQFLSTLFDVIPSREGDDTLYYFLLNTSLDYQQKLSKVASPIFLNELENLKKKVVELAEGILSANISSSITLLKGNHRTYFLEWFYCNALYSDEAFRIAIDLDKKDWQWLENKISQAEIKKNKSLFEEAGINDSLDPISFLLIKWMIQTASLSESAKQLQFSSAINSNLTLRLFFRHASSYIHSKNIPEENYRKFLEVLTPQSLFYYFDSFENSLKEITIKYLVDIKPQKLVSWLQLIVRDRGSTSSHTSKEVLCELFRLISRSQSFESIIDLILKTKDTPLKLSIFCALEKNTQIKFLDNIFNDQKEGVQTVAQWIHYCFFEDNLLKLYTTNFFKNNLHALLQESYPKIIQELKTHLNHTPTVESSKENQCLINSLLPIELNLNDPIVRQEEAIKKLGATFLNSNLSLDEKKAYISSIYGDLLANKTQYELLPKLFENLPKKTWPLIFINFEVRMFFKISPKNKHIAKSDLSHWIELSSKSLLLVVENPFFID
ncbi:MAG: hypothetical protein VX777_03995 [Chlamydiota bacterium]|nr:hypothetical protein [Chlamydiota bacterium]